MGHCFGSPRYQSAGLWSRNSRHFQIRRQRAIRRFGSQQLWRGGGGVFLWNFSGDPELVFDVNGNGVTDLALSPAQSIAAAITQHGESRCLGTAQVDLWNPDTREILKSIPFSHDASALAFSPDGKLLAVGTNDGLVHLFSMDTFQTLYEFRAEPGAFVRLAFRPDGKALAAATQNAVHVWPVNLP